MKPYVKPRLLYLALPPAIWCVHFLLCYVSTTLSCSLALQPLRWPGYDIAKVSILAVTLLALLLLGWLGIAHYHAWREAHHSAHDSPTGFLGLLMLMLCALAAVTLLWVAFPVLQLPPCEA